MSDAAAFCAALESASTAPEILAALARACWHNAHAGKRCPDEAIPTEPALCAWLKHCPEAARREARERLVAMYGAHVSGWSWLTITARYAGEASEDSGPDGTADTLPLALGVMASAEAVGLTFTDCGTVHRAWLALPEADRPKHPLAPFVAAWQEQPREVEPERRKDSRILPRIEPGAEHPERKAGMLFGGLHEGRRVEAPELPLFPAIAPAKRVPLLDLVDEAGVPVMTRGRGAPLVARLFVRTLASVKVADRGLATVRLAVTLRELIAGLFPTGGWRVGRDWPKLRHALLHARDYAIHDGRGRWFPVALRYLPDQPKLDDLVVLDVAFPPGSATGPTIDLPAMDQLSVQSAARWRAYIAAHSLAWRPGITRVPVPRAAGRYGWSRDPTHYPILTLDDRRRFAFGAGDSKHRTRTEIDAAYRDLPGLVILDKRASDPKTGEVGWRIVPANSPVAHDDDEESRACNRGK